MNSTTHMVTDTPAIDSTQPEWGYRTAKGEWRPPYPIKFAPLFSWPPQPIETLKWLLRWGGYLWPWNAFYAVLAMVTWRWFQPPMSSCVDLKAGWISYMFIRNLILLVLMNGAWHLLLYTFKVQGTKNKYDPRWLRVGDRKFLFHNQLYDNIFWSSVSGVTVWTAYEVLLFWAMANHVLPYVSWTAHPVYCTLWLFLIPMWREFHFFLFHHALHWKPMYKYFHYIHHKNVNPGPWSGLAMHPVEHVIYFSMVLIHFAVPSHPIHILFHTQIAGISPPYGHIGFEGPLLKGWLPAGSYFHYLHHRYFECNYGETTVPMDRLFGTVRDGLSDVLPAK